MAVTSTGIGNRQQIWNLGNNIIDTSKLVELELQALDMKKTPYNNEKEQLTQEKLLYASLKKEFSSLTQTMKDLSSFKGNEKKVTLSQEGYISVTADASAIAGTFNIEVKELAQRHQISSEKIADLDAKIDMEETIKINNQDIVITKDTTYRQLINKINSGNYGVSAYSLGNKIFFSSSKMGEKGAIKLEDSGQFLEKMGFVKTDGTLNEIEKAKNSTYVINGVEEHGESNTIETLPGVKIQLDKSEVGKSVKFTVEDSNVKEANELIKKMVSNYNQAVSTVELFGGKNGALQGQNIMGDIRRIMNNIVTYSQDGNYLFSYGIQVTKEGTLQVDEAKLTNALKENPDAAKQFFFSADGLGKQIDTQFNKIFGDVGIIGERIKIIDDRVGKLDRKINDIDIQNKQKQDDIVKKYQKLESTLAALDSQLKTIKAMTKQKSDD
ncbi:flagellar hook-associated protein 2 [Bacillus thuringiensis]|uniref:Flagellar hook-associated protein 2 n=7 Tax=Bacillus cereus group TaxID=86661 RepID=A0A9X6UK59_BACCE|nr:MULTISPECIES: flagellar hook-associated protein 2 [Bacillus]MED1154019.1 flagellar hook-associated protein 2 [Bacillus paranthracis]ACK93793.1 flagellar hook-associated protein [Bacillus cereus G9842]AFQ25401.1 flagellar capping protein [Bacillus thuringiensis HD-789]AJH03967.1 flagellar hook-associated family protein [Bacillus thuringiensis HD1002]AND23600.1 flagellar capping protein [Bacillus thuringiensis serovar israelensis]